MSEATIILTNMRGGCATDGDKVHALFRVTGRSKRNADTLNKVSNDIRGEAGVDSQSGFDPDSLDASAGKRER
jgi:hypothetical protein